MELLYRSLGRGDQRRQGAHALASCTAVLDTDSSLCESFLTEVCPSSADSAPSEVESEDVTSRTNKPCEHGSPQEGNGVDGMLPGILFVPRCNVSAIPNKSPTIPEPVVRRGPMTGRNTGCIMARQRVTTNVNPKKVGLLCLTSRHRLTLDDVAWQYEHPDRKHMHKRRSQPIANAPRNHRILPFTSTPFR